MASRPSIAPLLGKLSSSAQSQGNLTSSGGSSSSLQTQHFVVIVQHPVTVNTAIEPLSLHAANGFAIGAPPPSVPNFPYPPLPRVLRVFSNAQLAEQSTLPHQTVTPYTPQIIAGQRPAPKPVHHRLRTVADVLTHRRNHTIAWNGLSPRNDPTFPLTEAQCLAYADMFALAISDIRECKDKTRAPFPEQWEGPAMRGELHYADDDIADASWDLVDVIVTLQLFSPAALNIREPNLIKDIQAGAQTPFGERVTDLCKLLRNTKFTCNRIMNGENVEVLLASVGKRLNHQDQNSKNNPERSKKLTHYKRLLSASSTASPSKASADAASTQAAGSNMRPSSHASETLLSPDDLEDVAEIFDSQSVPIAATPAAGPDFETEFVAWRTRQSELQTSIENINVAHTHDNRNDLDVVGDDLADLEEDDEFVYLAAYNTANPLLKTSISKVMPSEVTRCSTMALPTPCSSPML